MHIFLHIHYIKPYIPTLSFLDAHNMSLYQKFEKQICFAIISIPSVINNWVINIVVVES